MNEVQESRVNPQPTNSLQFNSATIKPKAAQPLDPFAEQNAKAAEKKKQDRKKRRVLFIVLGALVSLAVVGAVVWLVVTLTHKEPETPPFTLPVINSNETSEVNKVQNQAQQIYTDALDKSKDSEDFDNNDAAASVNQYFDELLNTDSGKEYSGQVRIAQVMFYINNGFYDKANEAFSQIAVETLPKEQQALYYSYGGNIYNQLGDPDKASELYNEASKIRYEIGGYGG